MATDDQGVSKGYGFVHFVEEDSAEIAIANMNGMLLNDTKVVVTLHVPRKERQSKIDQLKSEFTNIYVKNLDEETTDEEVQELFAQFGTVTSAAVSRHPDGKSKGISILQI